MGIRFGAHCLQALGFALVLTLSLTLVPLVCFPAASFLGKDVSQLAVGVVSFYHWIALGELLKIFALAFVLAFFVGVGAAGAADGLRRLRWVVFPVAPLFAYGCWLIGSMLKYPALFEGRLPAWVQRLLFHIGFKVTPQSLFALAIIVATVPFLRNAMRLVRSVHRARAYRMVIAMVLLPLLLLLVTELSWPVRVEPRPAGANILFVGIDSLRTDRLQKSEVTPSLHELLVDPQTIVWRDHYVGIPRTFPSWIEMLQGLPAASTGIRHMFPGFAERSRPFAGWVSQLKGSGYETTVRSDFAGDIFPRFQAGFDHVYAPSLTLMTMIRLNTDQACVALLPMMITGPFKFLFSALKESPAYADPEHLGLEFRRQLPQKSSAGKPWLETLFFSTAHFPYAAPYPYYSLFSTAAYSGPYRFQKNPELSAGNDAADGEEVAQVRALYDGSIRAVDAELGRVFQQLKAQGLWDNTLVIVTADHGEDLFERDHLQGHGEHLRGENVLKVPLLIKLPKGLVPTVKDLDFTTRSIDIGATIMAAVRLPAAVGEGVNLLPWMIGRPQDTPKLLAYAETGLWFARTGTAYFQKYRLDYPGISGLLNFDQGYSGEIVLNPLYQQIMVTAKHRMMLDGDYKLIYMPTPQGLRYELYNRRTDPENFYDLSDKEPKILAALQQKLFAFVAAHESHSSQLVDQFVVPK